MGLKDTESDEFKGLLKGWNTGKDVNVFWNLWNAVQVFLGLVAGAEGPTLGLRLCCCLPEIPNTFILEVKATGTVQQAQEAWSLCSRGVSLPASLGWVGLSPFLQVLAPEPFTKHIACISLGYYSDKRYLAKKVFAILPSLYSGDLEKQLSSVYECLYSLMCMLKNYLKIICNADDFNN